jgi:hypothetical protein
MNLEIDVSPSDDGIASCQLGPLRFDSEWRPTSPKIQELKVRHEEHRYLEFNTAQSELKLS